MSAHFWMHLMSKNELDETWYKLIVRTHLFIFNFFYGMARLFLSTNHCIFRESHLMVGLDLIQGTLHVGGIIQSTQAFRLNLVN
jgi:hypothetical protein